MTSSDWKHWLDRAVEEASTGIPQFHLLSTEGGTLPDFDAEFHGRPVVLLRTSVQRERFLPYYPFLEWMRDLLPPNVSADLLLEEADVYFFQRPIFRSYLWGGVGDREEILPFEERWERDQFIVSIWNLFIHLLQGRVAIVILENAQELSASVLLALRTWRQRKLQGKVLVLCVQNGEAEPSDPHRRERWEEFVEEWGVWKYPATVPKRPASPRKMRRYSLRNLEDSLADLRRLLDFFCLEEADELASRIHGFYQRHPRNFPEALMNILLELYGWVQFRQGRYLQSVNVWAHLLSNIPHREWAERSRITRYLAQCFLVMREDEKASALSFRALELARQSEDPVAVFYAMHTVLWSEQNYPTLPQDQWKKEFRRFLELGQELDRVNALAYWLVNPYLMDSMEHVSEATYYQQWGIELCEKYKNYFLLSYGYLNIGYFWSIKGEYEKVLESYRKSEELKHRIGRLEELPQVYNSRGYFLMNIGDYIAAQQNFTRALSGLYHYRSTIEIGLTLFNLAINAFRAGLYERAERDFQRLFVFMRNLGIQNLIYHGKREVLLYLGLCHVHRGNLTRALETWLKISQEPPNAANYEEHLLYLVLKANILYFEEGKERLVEIYQEAEEHLLKHKVDLRFLVPWFYLYFGQLFHHVGMEDMALRIWRQGYMESFQIPNQYLRQKLQNRLSGSFEDEGPLPIPDVTGETIEWIIDTARLHKQSREVQKNKVSLDILMNFQELLSGLSTSEEILADTVRLIERGYLFDGLVLFESVMGNLNLLVQSPSIDEATITLFKEHLPAYRNHGSSLVIPDISQDPWNARDLHPSFGVIFVSGDFLGEYQLFLVARFALQFGYSAHEIRVLNLLVNQLVNQIGRRRREKNLFEENLTLRKMVFKDFLTGVHNRRGIQDKVRQEIQRLLRYDRGTCTVLLMEIVNISQINREMGFAVGDAVLRSAASLLDRMVRAVDTVGRIGGAVFCLLLPETGSEGASHLVERIRDRFAHFTYQLDREERSQHLELVFGGAQWRGRDEDLLERASLALRQAMETGSRLHFHGI